MIIQILGSLNPVKYFKLSMVDAFNVEPNRIGPIVKDVFQCCQSRIFYHASFFQIEVPCRLLLVMLDFNKY